jgi:hypothetical protein
MEVNMETDCHVCRTTYHLCVMGGGVSLWYRMLSKRELRERELLPLPADYLDEVAKYERDDRKAQRNQRTQRGRSIKRRGIDDAGAWQRYKYLCGRLGGSGISILGFMVKRKGHHLPTSPQPVDGRGPPHCDLGFLRTLCISA